MVGGEYKIILSFFDVYLIKIIFNFTLDKKNKTRRMTFLFERI